MAMCGRYSLARCLDIDLEELGVEKPPEGVPPRYNIAPTQLAPVITNAEPRRLSLLRWGLIPHWARDDTLGSRLINARAESLTEKPAFREAFRLRRCLVPADGFYEWRKEGKMKIPYRIVRRDRRVFAFAGLWERWISPDNIELKTFTIITTQSNAVVSAIHERMPVILLPSAYRLWLDTSVRDTQMLQKLLVPCPENFIEAYEVGRIVNDPSRDEPACIEPVRFVF